jgi:hypothetical protein
MTQVRIMLVSLREGEFYSSVLALTAFAYARYE